MRLGTLEIIGIVVVVLLLFGPGRNAKVAGEMGRGIKAFKDGLTGKESSEEETDSKENKD